MRNFCGWKVFSRIVKVALHKFKILNEKRHIPHLIYLLNRGKKKKICSQCSAFQKQFGFFRRRETLTAGMSGPNKQRIRNRLGL